VKAGRAQKKHDHQGTPERGAQSRTLLAAKGRFGLFRSPAPPRASVPEDRGRWGITTRGCAEAGGCRGGRHAVVVFGDVVSKPKPRMGRGSAFQQTPRVMACRRQTSPATSRRPAFPGYHPTHSFGPDLIATSQGAGGGRRGTIIEFHCQRPAPARVLQFQGGLIRRC